MFLFIYLFIYFLSSFSRVALTARSVVRFSRDELFRRGFETLHPEAKVNPLPSILRYSRLRVEGLGLGLHVISSFLSGGVMRDGWEMKQTRYAERGEGGVGKGGKNIKR